MDMAHKQVFFRSEARERILHGVTALTDAVRVTLGPKSKCVQLEGKCAGDERTGLQILRRALEAPTRQIAENSGVDGVVVVNQMRAGKRNWGFDAARKEYVDLVEAGIIAPTKVVRIALENAVSVSSLLLLTEATLTEVPDKKEALAVTHGMEHM